jgi:hypothetical protein
LRLGLFSYGVLEPIIMGMDQKVLFPPDKAPTWTQLSALLSQRNYPLQLRMIDGELAFPDETPPDAWRELRVSSRQGMVTLRREPDGITLVTWGNADQNMRQVWNALAWALAHLAGGSIRTMSGTVSLEEFVKAADLPAEFGSS